MTQRTSPIMWVDPELDPRERPDVTRGEVETVLDYLWRARRTLELKCEGLDAEQLALRAVPPSAMSLLGLVRHLAKVEHSWARRVLEGQSELAFLYRDEDGVDHDFDGAVADEEMVAEAWDTWRTQVEHAERVIAGIEDWSLMVTVYGKQIEVRDVMVHLLEEYSRHLGHVDLLRECIDGRTGL